MNRDMLLALCAYNNYANQIVLDTVSKLTEEELTRHSSPSNESVHALVFHMAGAEVFFLMACMGEALPPQPETLPSLAEIRGYFVKLAKGQEDFLRSLADDDFKREVKFQFGEHSFHLPLWQVFTVGYVHSVHHRGELSIVLSQLGYPLPSIDMIIPLLQWNGQEWPWRK